MSRAEKINEARVILHQTMGAMIVDNAESYQGTQSSLIDLGEQKERVNRVRRYAAYDETSMILWGGSSVKEGGGNCDDFAAATCYLLWKGSFKGIIEHVQAPGHAFVVIDRATSHDINKKAAWTNDTFIIDYWLCCKPFTRQVRTIWVPQDLLCDIAPKQEVQTVSSNPDDSNPFIDDLTQQPGIWYAGHRDNGKLKVMTTIIR